MKRQALPPRIDPKLAAVVLFTKPQMAAMLQISIRCLTDMMRRGEIAYLKINNRIVRFRLEDVNQRLGETVLVCPRAVEGHELKVESRNTTSPPAPFPHPMAERVATGRNAGGNKA